MFSFFFHGSETCIKTVISKKYLISLNAYLIELYHTNKK